MTAGVPAGLPVLRAGAHLGPEDGACLMEYVSVLAGSRFTDHPRCTDPTLAAFARLVNDSCSDAGRAQLAGFAPTLAGTPRGDAAGTPAVVEVVVRAAVAATGPTPALDRALRRAERRQRRVGGTGWRGGLARRLDTLYGLGPARHGLEVSVRAVGKLALPERDTVLVAMLAAAIDTRRAGLRPAAQAPSPVVG